MDMVTKGVIINILGLGSTLLGIQALVGVLVAKTLSNASANPFIASAAGVYNPVLALDVFLVQVGHPMKQARLCRHMGSAGARSPAVTSVALEC
jgi:hypothetical protein